MDDFQSNKMQGSIDGALMNGASLVAGKIGNAIFTDGISQYIDYGIHQSECFYNQDACIEGVTCYLWLKVHSDSATFNAIDTGATKRNSRFFLFDFSLKSWYKIINQMEKNVWLLQSA